VTWSAVVRPARLLTVIDVSGSMGGLVAGGGTSRQQVTVEAAKEGLALVNDDWDVGLWVFSTVKPLQLGNFVSADTQPTWREGGTIRN
jgi:hypothetical protein